MQTTTGRSTELARLAQQFRLEVLDVLHKKGTGHWGGASSVADLLTHLYFERMNIRPDDPKWEERDRLVLSKGHASAMLYTVLAHRGYFPVEEVQTFRDLNSRLQGHPCMNKTAGVEMSTGALGHGISVGLGMSLASQLSGKNFWSYVITGEGCLDEGQSWEGIMAAAKFKPKKLALLVDYNKVQLDGAASEIMPLDPLDEKFRAFGWRVAPKVYDGHNHDEIAEAFTWLDSEEAGPSVMIFRTHKGKGVSFMEDNHKWHGAPIDDETYAKARPELEAGLAKLEAK
ncbi:transketolase [Marispirochaeta aestuarii]|uniref:Transketolase n=1 Tax=Marispirochaeta aestuarii TaxID=1963862 RepID=A0A1Y1S1P6_9SPIO|nr:transketolase [Marispirochaeta aestuarii]ORC37734.1 transketolase [Marispirochaeta aestuarii]